MSLGSSTTKECSFFTKIVGVTFEGRQDVISELNSEGLLVSGADLILRPEPDNKYDSNAIAVLICDSELKERQLGYIRKELNESLIKDMQSSTVTASVSEITGGGGDKSYGVNIEITIIRQQSEDEIGMFSEKEEQAIDDDFVLD